MSKDITFALLVLFVTMWECGAQHKLKWKDECLFKFFFIWKRKKEHSIQAA